MAYDRLLVDGGWLLWRATFAEAADPSRSAVVRAFEIVGQVARENGCRSVTFTWDAGKAGRRAIFPGYKAGREERRVDLQGARDRAAWVVASVLPLLGVGQATAPGWEADDAMATLAATSDARTLVLTGDKDLVQVVARRVHVLRVGRGQSLVLHPGSFEERTGLRPVPSIREAWVSFQALRGDASDCYPGVRGIGEAGAVEALAAYPDVLARMLDRDSLDRIATRRTRTALLRPEAVGEAALSYSVALLRVDATIDLLDGHPFPDVEGAERALRSRGEVVSAPLRSAVRAIAGAPRR